MMCIDCGSMTMPDESRVDVATYVPIRAGMTLCESISFHFSTKNWKPSRDFCQDCNEHEEKEVLKNPGVDWTNPEQNLILVKPTFEDGAIGASKTKFSIGSNALIGNNKFQCVGCVVLDSDNGYFLFVKRLGDWYKIQGMETPIFQHNIEEPKDGLIYLFAKDKPDYV